MKCYVAILLLALCSAGAVAQGPTPAPRPTAPAGVRDIDPNALAQAALQILQTIDREQTGALWDSASNVTQRSTHRAEFVARVGAVRKPLGPANARRWTAVRREGVGEGRELPPGVYASIEFASQFQGRRSAIELVSLRLDEDGRWRFSGYVIQ